jgi:sigma-E factor negative regulatory protein RseB
VSRRIRPGWRIAGLAAIVGLLGSGVAALAVAGVPAGPPVAKGPNPSGRPLWLARVPRAARTGTIAPAGARQSAGLRLLEGAAVACQDTAYSGLQVVTWWSQHRARTSVVEVWHQPGSTTLMQSAGTPLPQLATVPVAGAAAEFDPDGLLRVSGPLLVLLRSNYQVVYTGPGSADSRSALIVEVRRPGGRVAARFWLDAATKLPLRREIYAADGHLISEDAFINLQLGSRGLGGMPAAVASPRMPRLDRAGLTVLRAQGWPLPGQLPANLELFAATRMADSPGQVVELTYSDGLAVVSLFVERGELGQSMPGWHPVVLHGRTVYAVDPDEMCFAWSAGGFVYTLVADAPMATVSQVVAALPDTGGPGFWVRMARGLRRLVSWLNPLH